MDIKITVIVCLALVTFCQCEEYPKFEEKIDPGKEEIALQRMITDSTGSLYIGSVNRLYKLSSELEVEQEVVTGPKDDNSKPDCIPPDFNDADCDELFPTNNVNKILVLDTRRDWVITCGSVYKGTCQTRNKQTLDIEKEFFARQVASASPSASTVGLIAPGPDSDVLYVARSDVSATRTRWEALTSRVLPVRDANDDEAFEILSSEILQNTAVIRGDDDYLNNHPDFNIEYVYGFSSNGFMYYVAVQPVGDSGPFVTRIVQICQTCPLYQETYIDLPLVCRSNSGTEYNLAQSAYATQAGTDLSQDLGLNNQDDKTIVIVAFAKSDGTSSTPTDESAVCIYPVKTIREKYLEWINDCSNNADKQPGCDWSAQQIGIDCGTGTLDYIIGDNMCDCRTFGKMTCGSLDIVKTASFTTTGSRVTAVAATTHLSHTVMFTGDNSGQLKKMKVTSGTSATEYEAITVVRDNPEIVQNGLVFDNQKNFIYVMSKRQITKVPVENSEQYTNCEDCTAIKGVGDPYCGWCSLENKCSRKAECAGSNDDNSNRWIGNLVACPSIVVLPASVEIGQLETLTLTVTSLPETSGAFRCVFANIGSTAAVKKEQNGSELTCSTPSPTNVPAPGDRGFVRVKLSLLADETDVNFVSVDFDFYECESFKTCMACTNNSYGCDWCIFENKCSKDTTTCRNDGVVQGNANAEGSSDRCPQITAGDDILIPVDVDQEYQVKGKNFPTATSGQSGYQCVLIIEGVEVVVDGQRVDEQTVRCQSSKYVYAQEVSNMLVPLKLRWKSGFDVDNPDNVQVNLYKCDVGRSNCGVCHQADLKYECGWCESRDEEQKCTVVSKCSQVTHWLTRDKICPDPTISEMKPMAGPIEGGTTLTIRGYNLGKNASNVKEVTVVGFPCTPVPSGYKIAQQVQCVTSPSDSENSGKVQITIGDTGDQVTYTGTSTEDFSYVVSKIDGLTPVKGPQSGGTIVTISGENLNAGSVITATVAEYPCHITESSFDAITCVTSASDSSFPSGGVTVTFDGVAKTNTDAIYRYMADPVIQQLSRYEAFVRGGSKIEVTGGNLDIVQTRIMRVYIKGRYYDAGCNLKSSTLMECYTPDVSASGIQPTAEEPYECDFGFIMDSVANTTHLKDSLEPYFYYPNPKYIDFEDGVKVYAGAGKEPLVIAGENLNLASNEVDVIVKIGDEFCEVTSLAWNQLTCSPPERPRGDSQEKGLEVTIYHGNVNVSIGVLKYSSSNGTLRTIIVLAATATAGCIVITVIAIILWKFNVRKNKKAVKQAEIRLNVLQSEIATQQGWQEQDFENSNYESISIYETYATIEDVPVEEQEMPSQTLTATGIRGGGDSRADNNDNADAHFEVCKDNVDMYEEPVDVDGGEDLLTGQLTPTEKGDLDSRADNNDNVVTHFEVCEDNIDVYEEPVDIDGSEDFETGQLIPAEKGDVDSRADNNDNANPHFEVCKDNVDMYEEPVDIIDGGEDFETELLTQAEKGDVDSRANNIGNVFTHFEVCKDNVDMYEEPVDIRDGSADLVTGQNEGYETLASVTTPEYTHLSNTHKLEESTDSKPDTNNVTIADIVCEDNSKGNTDYGDDVDDGALTFSEACEGSIDENIDRSDKEDDNVVTNYEISDVKVREN
ncbi:plexin-A2-like [Ptychodera flava]|uniref:plexin-A2-like n=1 Tax=Ptychodera flava TaxID=63121 RepID=UPI00396A62D9